MSMAIRHDWSLDDLQAIYDLPLLNLVFRAANVHRQHHDPQEMQSSIDIVLRRFAEYHALEGAFGRRAVTERAKGILMERHNIDEQTAFSMLPDIPASVFSTKLGFRFFAR